MYTQKSLVHTHIHSQHTSQSTTHLLFILMGLICFLPLREANNAEGMAFTLEVGNTAGFLPRVPQFLWQRMSVHRNTHLLKPRWSLCWDRWSLPVCLAATCLFSFVVCSDSLLWKLLHRMTFVHAVTGDRLWKQLVVILFYPNYIDLAWNAVG